MKLGYWNIRGLGQPIRLMFEYSGMKYEEKTYIYYETPEQALTSEWQKEKASLGLPFPNVPYLIDGDIKMTESQAICKHLAKKMGLMPLTDEEVRDCDMVYGSAHDIRVQMAILVYFPGMENRIDEVKEFSKMKLKQMDEFLTGRKFAAGEKLTYVDFNLYEVLDHCRLLYPGIHDGFANVIGFMERFEALKGIQAYHQSDRYHKFPIYGKIAAWGGKDYDDRTW